jgi:hypothetical protein
MRAFQQALLESGRPFDNDILAHPTDFAFQQRQGNPSRFCNPCGMVNMLCGSIIDGLAMEPPDSTRSGASRRSTVSVAVAQALPKMQVSAVRTFLAAVKLNIDTGGANDCNRPVDRADATD